MALMKLLLLLLGLGVAVNSDSVSLQKRITGGEKCPVTERHYHVVIIGRKGTKRFLCGGSLISDQWVLTAAHCWKSEPGWTIKAYLGVHPGNVPVETQIITEHEIYRDPSNLEHDIMLLKLPEKTEIKPIKRTECKTSLSVGTKVQIAGFEPGYERQKSDYPTNLQCADIEIVDLKTFNDNLLVIVQYWYQYWNCAGSSTKGVSKGDSGGGLVYQNRLYGVNSFSGDLNNACSKPVGFLEVCAYRDWIDKTIKPRKGLCLSCG